MYWFYDLPNSIFELLTIILFVAFSLTRLLASRRMIRRVSPEPLQCVYRQMVNSHRYLGQMQ